MNSPEQELHLVLLVKRPLAQIVERGESAHWRQLWHALLPPLLHPLAGGCWLLHLHRCQHLHSWWPEYRWVQLQVQQCWPLSQVG